MEDLTLLSGSIAGTVWNDVNGDGARQSGEPGVAGQLVYLDLNRDGQLDTTTSTASDLLPTLVPAPGPITSITGAAVAAQLPVQGLPARVADVEVSLDVFNGGSSPVTVGVFSPFGATVPNFPNLLVLQPGEHFVGSFDGNAQNPPITLAGDRPAPRTYQPLNNFTDPPAHIYDGNPNGSWGLVFVGDTSGLVLHDWSLTFQAPEPSTTTDANGAYAFPDLNDGTYQVATALATAATQTSPATVQAVAVGGGQTASGVDFGIQPASHLSTTSFYLDPATLPAAWGHSVTIDYTLTNSGNGDAPAFDIAVLLSSSGALDTANPSPIATLHVAGLAANSSRYGSVDVALPATPPPGFGATPSGQIGFLIDPAHALAHNDPANDANQGLGTDMAALATASNVAVTSGASTQQDPTVAVDPNDPNHVVVAYMDYGLASTGYAGIGMAVSHDGGNTWTHSVVPVPVGFDQGTANPVVQFDGLGHVFVAFMATTFLDSLPSYTNPPSNQRLFGFESNNGIFVARSDDGGATWGTPATVVSHTYTGTPGDPNADPTKDPNDVLFDITPTLAVDTFRYLPDGSLNPYYGNLYVTWVRLYPHGQYPGDPSSTGGSDIMFAASSTGGRSWTTETQTRPGTSLQVSAVKTFSPKADSGQASPGRGFSFYPEVSVGPEGDVYVSAYEAGAFNVFHSTDGGRSFVPPSPDQGLGVPFQQTGLNILPGAMFGADQFRTTAVRDIAADPSHPGRVYVVDANSFANQALGTTIPGATPSSGDIVFAVSNDYGQTWEPIVQAGKNTGNLADLPVGNNQADTYISLLNDDNNGNNVEYDSIGQLANEVQDSHAMPSISVDAQGNLTVIWYDSRRDPLQGLVDVFGTVSHDGGKTFTPNFRITDTSFDPNAGAFADPSDPNGANLYMGDHISVAAANGVAYAVWTDTRNGTTQQIESSRYSLTLPPAPPLNRLAPNNSADTAAYLGEPFVPLTVPRMTFGFANDNWYAVTMGANGLVAVTATIDSGDASQFQLELTDLNGNTVPSELSRVAPDTWVLADAKMRTGQTYFIRASSADGTPIGYSLTLANYTQQLGTSVQGSVTGVRTSRQILAYPLQIAVSGTLHVDFHPSAKTQGLQLVVTNALGLFAASPLGTVTAIAPSINVPVTQGDTVFLYVYPNPSAKANFNGDFGFDFTNYDQYEQPGSGVSSLFFPTTGDPSSVAIANLSGPSQPADIIVSSTNLSDALNVLAGNGDGTFQAARQYEVGPGLSGGLDAGNRQIGLADLNGDGLPDVIVPNFRSGDISVLLGNGDATLQPQRTFDAVPSPGSLVTGTFVAGDNHADVAVLQSSTQFGGRSELAILIGRGDGTFRPAIDYPTVFSDGAGPMVVGDFNNDGKQDIVVFSKNQPRAEIFMATGDPNDPFKPGRTFDIGENVFSATAYDIDGDGNLDLIYGGTNTGNVYIMPGLGDGTFIGPFAFPAVKLLPGENVGIGGIDVVDFGRPIGDGTPGAPDGHPDIVATAQSRAGDLPAQVILMPAEVDQYGLEGFGTPYDGNAVVLATAGKAGQIAHGDLTANGAVDLVVADKGGVRVIYGTPPTFKANNAPDAPRNLGAATHIVTDPQAIVSGYEDAYFRYTVAGEASSNAPEAIDLAAVFQNVVGAGLQMEVTDATGGIHFAGQASSQGNHARIVVPQGDVLTIHVFGATAAGQPQGTGAFRLDVDVLPQVVGVQAQSVIAGAPASSIVLTLAGDRLDPATAENPANYVVTWVGPDGLPGTPDDQVIPIAASSGVAAVVYDPSANIDVASGLTYPTAVRQTITLLFDHPLPAGSYLISVAPTVAVAPYGAVETTLATDGTPLRHNLASAQAGQVVDGATVFAQDLVAPAGGAPDVGTIARGSNFLTQLQGDLSALLDQLIRQNGDDPAITPALQAQIASRLTPLYAAGGTALPSFAVLWFDPVSIDLQAPQAGAGVSYSLATNAVTNTIGQTFVQVGGNVELLVLANASGTFNLDVSNVPSTARGGEVQLSASGMSSLEFTDALRSGTTSFQLSFNSGEGGSSPTPDESGGGTVASAVQTGLALLSTGVVSTPVALGPSGAITTAATESEGAAVATGAGTSSTGNAPVVMPLPGSRGNGNGSTTEELFQDLPTLDSLRPLLRNTVQFVKKWKSRVSGVVSALGLGRGLLGVQLLDRLIDALSVPAEADAGADTPNPGQKPGDGGPAADAAPAAPTPDVEAAIEALDRILHDRSPDVFGGCERSVSQPERATDAVEAYWAIAFLAAGAYHARLREAARNTADTTEKRFAMPINDRH